MPFSFMRIALHDEKLRVSFVVWQIGFEDLHVNASLVPSPCYSPHSSSVVPQRLCGLIFEVMFSVRPYSMKISALSVGGPCADEICAAETGSKGHSI
jgi:hypothetical protein